MENNEVKYPLQAFKVKRTTKTLGVDSYLSAPDGSEKSCSPLELHNGYSRFLFTLVDKSNAGVTVTPRANIPARDIPCIELYSRIAAKEYLLGNTAAGSEEKEEGDLCNSPAYTQKILMGTYKGKTPAEILIANPKEKENLLQTKKLLSDNVDKFPANKFQIKAIEDAISLLEIGELQSGTPSAPKTSSSVKTIYKTEYKHMSQKNEKGDTLVYSISITFDASKNYPFNVEITNCFAPIEVLQSGQHRPIMNKATHMTKSSLALSDSEWISLIDHISSLKKYFELTNFKPLLTVAQNNSYQHNK